MKIEIKVPPLGESVTEAHIGNLLKLTGTVVRADEEIVELETDKVNQVLYAPAAGTLTLNVKNGDTVKVGQVIGYVDSDGKAAPAPAPKKVEPAPQPAPKATPSKQDPVRKMGDEFLAEISRPEMPVPAEPAAFVKTSERTTRQRMTKLRRVIAQKLVEVKNQTAMLTTFNELDMNAVMAVREKEQENFQKKYGIKLGFMSFFVKACVAALQEFPAINGRIEGEDVVYCNYYDIGIAVSTDKGLMVPILRNADQMGYADIEKALKMYADKARTGTIAIDDLQGGTFTITNGGVFGSLLSTPILNPPQSGILGMHNIVKRPVVESDQIVIRPMMYLALSYDHRIVDGKESIGFLMHLKKNLENPARILLDL
ncbi:MAG: dihydrolipoyllysine-residue succinyltransferase [Verrucomicrobiota bacterium]|nr:dihydrolipoyllysine-residue succinyltransferase [Verrucomicrobiota bacterium]